MANANTNLMSININTSASSTGSTSKNLGLHSSQKGGSDFNSALDRANNEINQQSQAAQGKPSDAEEIQYTEATAQNPAAPVEQPKNSKSQGENQQPQDAPQNVPQNNLPAEKNIPAEISVDISKNVTAEVKLDDKNISLNVEFKPNENISLNVNAENIEVPQEVLAALPFIFNSNAENLLPVQNSQKVGEVNLMTVVPQEGGDKAQAMLNFLSGKTWTAEDVKASIAPQNQQAVQVNPDTLQFQSGKNFTLNTNQNQSAENVQPQILIQSTPIQTQQQNLNPQQNLNLQQQPQNLNLQQTNLNSEQSPQIQQQPLMQTQPQVELQNQPIVNSLQPQVELKPVHQQQQISDLVGQNLQIEDNQNAAPLSPVQPSLRQQPEQNQQQPANQNLQQNFSQDLNSEMQVQQNVGGEESFAQNLTPATNNNVVSNTQPAAQVQNPETSAQDARQNENIPAQIVEQARLIRNAENTEMVINLKPEHLGQLTLRVSVSQNGAVNASFYSDNAQVRAAIENSLVQLRQELNDQGLKVDNVQVYAGLSDGGLTNGQGGQAWQQQQQNAPRRIDFNSLQEEVDAVTPANEISAEGVDYKI